MPRIGEVVSRIKDFEEKREKASRKILGLEVESLESEVVLEEGFLKDADSKTLDRVSVAGVDGGLLKKEFSGVDIVLSRAVASFFSFEDGCLSGSHTVPENMVMPDVEFIRTPLDRKNFNLSSSLIRIGKEVSIAISAVEEEPDIVLLDGSVVPQYTERPENGTRSRELYDEIVGKYRKLFRKAEEHGVLLAGVIEDSRSTRFCEELSTQDFLGETISEVVRNTRDTNMLEYLMKKGQRTPVMSYTKEYKNHQVLKDIGEMAENVYNFYLKTAEKATPVRIDFLNTGKIISTAEEISGFILPLCSYSSTYGFLR